MIKYRISPRSRGASGPLAAAAASASSVLVAARYGQAVVRLSRFRLRRALSRYATLAAGVVVAAIAIAFLVEALGGDTGGKVLDKRLVTEMRCNDLAQTCDPRICYQIVYLTDSGSHKITCLAKDEFDRIQVGSRYVR
jgi:anti-sigma factor RsiW